MTKSLMKVIHLSILFMVKRVIKAFNMELAASTCFSSSSTVSSDSRNSMLLVNKQKENQLVLCFLTLFAFHIHNQQKKVD